MLSNVQAPTTDKKIQIQGLVLQHLILGFHETNESASLDQGTVIPQ